MKKNIKLIIAAIVCAAVFTSCRKDEEPKTVTVDAQTGTIMAGETQTATFAVMTANIADGSYAPQVTNLPAGVTAQGNVAISNNSGTLTLAGSAGAQAGTTDNLTLTIDGATSQAFTLTIAPAPEIAATNVINSSSQIVTVKFELLWETGDDWGYVEIARAPYQNNGFTLKLPLTVQDKYLFLLAEDMPSGMTVSDKTVKWIPNTYIEAYDKNDENIGEFYFNDHERNYADDEQSGAFWAYADGNVTLKGEIKEIDEEWNEEYIYKFDLDLQKGWNILYDRWTESHDNSTGRDMYTVTVTTQKPSGANYQWYFRLYGLVAGNEYQAVKSGKKPVTGKNFFYRPRREMNR
ncbi:MAG: hypothetical protein LBE91_18165 [Tannerella sp.]|jgi:hypothetical protein|nr:hypothetical protein [Tannerella sp.]